MSGNYSRKLSVKVIIKSTIGREPAEVWCCRTERRAASFSLDFGRVFETRTPVGQVSAGNLELRSRSGISGSQIKPRATSEGRKEVGMNRIDQADNVNKMTCVNSPSSPTGIARGGKSSSIAGSKMIPPPSVISRLWAGGIFYRPHLLACLDFYFFTIAIACARGASTSCYEKTSNR